MRQAYAKGATSAEAAFLAGVTVSVLQARLNDQVRDIRKGRGRGGRRGKPVDLTPDEIAERRADVDARRRLLMGCNLYDPTNLD